MSSVRRSFMAFVVVAVLLLVGVYDVRWPLPVAWRVLPLLIGIGTGWLMYAAARSFKVSWSLGSATRSNRLLLIYGVFMLLMVSYVFNATHRWEDGVGLLPVNHLKGLPGSAYPEGTKVSWLILCGVFVSVGCALMWHQRAVRLFYGLLGVLATVSATVAVWQRLTPQAVYPYTGMFVSPNHFAAWANLALPLLLVVAARIHYQAYQAGRLSNPSPLIYSAALLVVGSVVMTGSRAGSLISILLLALFYFYQQRIHRRYPFLIKPSNWLTQIMAIGSWVLLMTVFMAVIVKGWSRLDSLITELSFRMTVLADVVTMGLARPWWGIGPGSFVAAFPYYQSEALQHAAFTHAHCEPLQFVAEFGLFGTALWVSALVWIARGDPAPPASSSAVPSFGELECFGAFLALLGVSLHGLVDFPFRQPVILWAAASCAGILLAAIPHGGRFVRMRRSVP